MKYGLLLLLLLLCIFNTPLFVVSAETEENELTQRAKADAEMDTKKDVIVKTARRDAEANTSKLWNLGCLLPPACMVAGAWVGYSIGHSSDPAVGWEIFSDSEAAGLLIGGTVGCLTPLASVSNSESTPNPKAFIGKSPEYISLYTATYKQRSKELKYTPIIAGIGGSLLWLVVAIFSG